MKTRLPFVLVSSLVVAAAAWAQGGSTGAALVDSREECVALEGKWSATPGGWQAACEVPWSRDDCLQLGASWTEVAKSAAGGRCVARVSLRATARQCADHGGKWQAAGSGAPQCSFEPARVARAQARALDAGKLCDSQADCTYGCVYQGPPLPPRSDVMGRCRASNQASGCFSMVESGRLAGRICRN